MSAGRVPTGNAGCARDRALRALALAAERHDPQAVAEVEAAVALAPSDPGVHIARSAVLREAGHEAEALRAADEAVRLAPDDPRAHGVRAAALVPLGRVADARAAAERAARLAPEDPAVLRRLGDLAMELDPAESERQYRGSVRRDPHSAAAHDGLARALRRLGRSEEAEVEYERAAAADPAVLDLRRRARALLSLILQAAVGTFLAVVALGWIPDLLAIVRPDAAGRVAVVVSMLAAVGPLGLLAWTAVRIRRLRHEAPISPEEREELREIAEDLGRNQGGN